MTIFIRFFLMIETSRRKKILDFEEKTIFYSLYGIFYSIRILLRNFHWNQLIVDIMKVRAFGAVLPKLEVKTVKFVYLYLRTIEKVK